jgi:PPOX class probable F420-dependent enzyme
MTRLEDPMASIPQSHADLFTKPAIASFATVNENFQPQVTPVWCDFDGTHILVNTARGRKKEQNLQRNSRVALAIIDPQNPYRYLGVQGHVAEMTGEGADAHIDKMAKKYIGQDRYPYRQPGEQRVLVKIVPDKVHVVG